MTFSCRNQLTTRFQLAKFRVTIFRQLNSLRPFATAGLNPREQQTWTSHTQRRVHPTRAIPPQLDPRTVTTYRPGINALRYAVGNDSELTKADLQRFVISMRERGLTAGGCNMYIRTINSSLTWLHEDGRVPARQRSETADESTEGVPRVQATLPQFPFAGGMNLRF